jgi:hypothetical protein
MGRINRQLRDGLRAGMQHLTRVTSRPLMPSYLDFNLPQHVAGFGISENHLCFAPSSTRTPAHQDLVLSKWFILLSSHPPGNYLLYCPHASNLITKDDQIFPGQFCWSGNCVALVLCISGF